VRLRLAVLLLTIVACKKSPHVGDACEPLQKGRIGCENEATLLYCLDMKVRAVPCRGPKGCAKNLCDTTLAREGEACEMPLFGAPPNLTCGEGIVLECKGQSLGRWTATKHCRGPKKCSGSLVPDCDQTVAEVGDVCNGTSTACSVDGKKLLECDDEKFKEVKDCAGGKGCAIRTTSDGLTIGYCDYGNAAVGTACGKGNEGLQLCSADGATLLACDPDTLKFAVDTTCKKGERCSKESGVAHCLPSP
jgi:hypothetical protein